MSWRNRITKEASAIYHLLVKLFIHFYHGYNSWNIVFFFVSNQVFIIYSMKNVSFSKRWIYVYYIQRSGGSRISLWKMINPIKVPLKLNPCINFVKIITTIFRWNISISIPVCFHYSFFVKSAKSVCQTLYNSITIFSNKNFTCEETY